jgi:serine-type D-Ala-D-Ala carboxypeptidase (penicillin-binding protein 5/6)
MRSAPLRRAAAVVGGLAGSLLIAAPASAHPAIAAPASAHPAIAVPASAHPATTTGPAGVVAASAELVNAAHGQWIWGRNTLVEHPIASITKVMTALVVIDTGTLNRVITVTKAAETYGSAYDPSRAGLHPGDRLTTLQLLSAMLLPSGSDAAYLLATTYGPGWPAFVRKMNYTAARLGMTRTHYANFDGLPWPTEYSTYSTARDLMKLAEAAMSHTVFRQIVSQRAYLIKATRQHHHYYWRNTNLLLGHYRGALGIKTGFTQGAGYCLLFEAERDHHELLGVVLDSTGTDPHERFTSATNLLNWGFDGYPAHAPP